MRISQDIPENGGVLLVRLLAKKRLASLAFEQPVELMENVMDGSRWFCFSRFGGHACTHSDSDSDDLVWKYAIELARFRVLDRLCAYACPLSQFFTREPSQFSLDLEKVMGTVRSPAPWGPRLSFVFRVRFFPFLEFQRSRLEDNPPLGNLNPASRIVVALLHVCCNGLSSQAPGHMRKSDVRTAEWNEVSSVLLNG